MTWNVVWNMIWDMMWYEIIWYEIICYGMMWYGMIWCYIHCWGKGCHTPCLGWGLRRPLGGSFNLFKCHQRGCLNNPISSHLGKYAECWACFHASSRTATNSSESSIFLSPYLFMSCWSKHCQRITILRIVFQKLALPGCFLCILFALFSPYFLLVGLLL